MISFLIPLSSHLHPFLSLPPTHSHPPRSLYLIYSPPPPPPLHWPPTSTPTWTLIPFPSRGRPKPRPCCSISVLSPSNKMTGTSLSRAANAFLTSLPLLTMVSTPVIGVTSLSLLSPYHACAPNMYGEVMPLSLLGMGGWTTRSSYLDVFLWVQDGVTNNCNYATTRGGGDSILPPSPPRAQSPEVYYIMTVPWTRLWKPSS